MLLQVHSTDSRGVWLRDGAAQAFLDDLGDQVVRQACVSRRQFDCCRHSSVLFFRLVLLSFLVYRLVFVFGIVILGLLLVGFLLNLFFRIKLYFSRLLELSALDASKEVDHQHHRYPDDREN